jgi:segregation and condensation protein B
VDLSRSDLEVLALVATSQPVARARLTDLAGRPVSRDTLAWLRQQGLIATGPRLPQPGAPATYVTTDRFLEVFGLENLGDLQDMAAARSGSAAAAEGEDAAAF